MQVKLSALWAALMFLYIYADIFSLYRPGQFGRNAGRADGSLPVDQGSLLMASILMLIPALMVFLALALKPRLGRWANIILGVLYTAVNIGNLVGETWAFYLLFGSWRWRSRF